MCDTPFKTPLPYNTPKHHEYYTPKNGNSEKSDSEESTTSTGESGYAVSSSDLSIVAVFDDLMRMIRQRRYDKIENTFLAFAEDVKDMWSHWQESVLECQRLQDQLEKKVQECSELERAVTVARTMIDKKQQLTMQVEMERDNLEFQLSQIRDVFNQRGGQISEEAKKKLDFLNNYKPRRSLETANGVPGNLSIIQEINSTVGSNLSDYISVSGDDSSVWRKHRPSSGDVAEPATKKRRSSGNKVVEINTADTVRATTTLTVTKEGPITATSIIESVPKEANYAPSAPEFLGTCPSAPPANLILESWARESPRRQDKINLKPHTLQQKTIMMPEVCGPCDKRIRWGKTALKCKECRVTCHLECKDKLALPCIANTPGRNLVGAHGIISDFTPTTSPMVPGIIIHCVNEVELRGLAEIGLYRIPGSERDVKMLKEKFLKGKGAPNLNEVDVHVICGTIKDFLRSLNEPIVTYGLWRDFVAAVEAKDAQDTAPALYQAIAELPQPNRDTLAYMILHLQRIASSPECKMPISNLAKVFGPTIVGYSSDNPNSDNLLTETRQQLQVMENLIRIPSDYWSTFVNVIETNTLRHTPSTDSLLRKDKLFTPKISRNFQKKKQKFTTPPYYK